jgi:hypothetical protein
MPELRGNASLAQCGRNPKLDWRFFEYFGPSFRVIEEVAPATLPKVTSFRIGYQDHDKPLARNL